MLTSHHLWTVHMKRKVTGQPKRYTKDVLIQATTPEQAREVAKQVHRGYVVDHVASTGLTFWRNR